MIVKILSLSTHFFVVLLKANNSKRPFADEHHFTWWRDVMAWEQPCGGCTMNTGDCERAKRAACSSGCTVMAVDCRLVLGACSLVAHSLFIGCSLACGRWMKVVHTLAGA